MNKDNIEIRPSPEHRSGDGNDSVYEDYGNVYEEYETVDVEELNVDLREVSEENGNGRDEERYEEYDGDYEPYRPKESESNFPKLTNKKISAIILVVVITGIIVGLSVHFTSLHPPPDNSTVSTISSTIQTTISNITTPTMTAMKPPETVWDTSGKRFKISFGHSFCRDILY